MKTVVISMITIMIINSFPRLFTFYLTNAQINYKISNITQI